ncbi:MAG: Phage capsid family protein [Methanobacterium sp. PtaB.Bin024]|nr:MAG: Phage capsid family protein [Methanobacterium sp. PtaB.Bin024]
MTTIKEAMEGHFASKSDLVELQKAINTGASSAGDIIEPEIDPQLQNMVVKKYPFYSYLNSLGRVTGTRSNKPAFLKKVSGGAGGFISEGGTLTSATDSVYDLLTGTMTTWNFQLEITDQMIMGSQDSIVDIYDQEIQDGLEAHLGDIDRAILTGESGGNNPVGLSTLITTNTDNFGGTDEITDKFQLDSMCDTIMDAGGMPSALVTSSNVKSQLEDVLYPNVNAPLIPRTEMAFGFQVTRYDSPAGEIPIIVDPALAGGSDDEQILFVDYSTVMLKYLMEPRVIDLAKTKLTTPSVLASFQSFMCRAENFNGKIYGIKTKT